MPRSRIVQNLDQPYELEDSAQILLRLHRDKAQHKSVTEAWKSSYNSYQWEIGDVLLADVPMGRRGVHTGALEKVRFLSKQLKHKDGVSFSVDYLMGLRTVASSYPDNWRQLSYSFEIYRMLGSPQLLNAAIADCERRRITLTTKTAKEFQERRANRRSQSRTNAEIAASIREDDEQVAANPPPPLPASLSNRPTSLTIVSDCCTDIETAAQRLASCREKWDSLESNADDVARNLIIEALIQHQQACSEFLSHIRQERSDATSEHGSRFRVVSPS